MRVIVPSPAGFKSLNDIEPVWGVPAEELIERTGLALDLATPGTSPPWPSPRVPGRATRGLVGMGLYQTLTLAALCCGIGWFVAIFDMPVFRLIRWKLRLIFAGFKGLARRPYLGSAASIPAWCDVLDAERRLAAADPHLHQILVGASGWSRPCGRSTSTAVDRLVASCEAYRRPLGPPVRRRAAVAACATTPPPRAACPAPTGRE